MSVSVNKVILIGNCGSEPEMRFTPAGKPVTSFRMATNQTYNDSNGEKQTQTEWHSIVTWNKSAEFCNQYIKKGSLVYVEGKLQTRSWDGNDGVKHYKTEIVASRVNLLDRKEQSGEEKPQDNASEGDVTPEDIPF
jgi:single-strand DNA-binding protein